MGRFESPLNNIKVASPCPANWDEMYGDNRKRFCGDCKLNVYNFSGMTRDEAEDLIMNAEGRLCVKFFKRADGSVITQDCPVGWAKVKQRARMLATAAISLVMTLFGGLLFASVFGKQKEVGKGRWFGFPTPTPKYERTVGMIALPSPTPTPKATPRGEKTMGVMIAPKKDRPRVNDNEPILN
jgi:hypothetical protein